MNALQPVEDPEMLAELLSAHDVILAYLFGSQAEGKAGPLSDLDFAVLLDPEVEREAWTDVQIELLGKLMSLFGRNDVDLVILNRATPVLAHQVAQHGQVLYEADPGTRADFEVAALRRYVETEPLRRIQDQAFLEQIEIDRAVIGET
jgi:hypothetical protein